MYEIVIKKSARTELDSMPGHQFLKIDRAEGIVTIYKVRHRKEVYR